MWALYFKGAGIFFVLTDVVYVVCWRRSQDDTWISVWALCFKGAGIFFVLMDVVYVVCWRRSQDDTWISVWALYFKGAGIFLLTDEDDLRTILGYRCGPYISKALGFSYDCWRRSQDDTWISVWALYFKGAGIFFVLMDVVYVVCWRRSQDDTWYRCGPYISKALGFSYWLFKTISGRYLVSVWALYFKGAGIFLLTVEDDLRTILGYRCGPYISKALGFSLLTTEDGFSFILGVDSLALYV